MSKASRERERIRNEKFQSVNYNVDLKFKSKIDNLKSTDIENFKILKNWTKMMSYFMSENGEIISTLPSGEFISMSKNEVNYLLNC